MTLLIIIAPVEKKQQVNKMRKKGEKIEEKEKTKESIAGAYLTRWDKKVSKVSIQARKESIVNESLTRFWTSPVALLWYDALFYSHQRMNIQWLSKWLQKDRNTFT